VADDNASEIHGSDRRSTRRNPEPERGTPVHDRQRTRREPADAVRVEDVIPAEILNDTRVDRVYLEQVFREPQKYLPPRAKQEPAREPEQPPREPESSLARRAKLVGLVAAAALVVGSIITASTLTDRHRAQPPLETAGAKEFTGAAALGGFAVAGAPSTERGDAKTSQRSPRQTSSPAPVAETEQHNSQVGGSTPTPTSTPTTQQGSATTTTAEKLVAVKKFYEMVDRNPQGALAMLEPLLAGEQPGDLVRAWSSMDAVEVQDAEVQSDGSILAIVTMLQPDGGYLRVTQLLRLADDASGLISAARLLSTQRM
jgi:hypothetical protein